MGLKDVAAYLIARRLAGDGLGISVVRDYFVSGLGPAEIAYRYGLRSKYAVRGLISRIYQYLGCNSPACCEALKALLRRYYEFFIHIEPIVTNGSKRPYCKVCGRYLKPEKDKVLLHVLYHHMDLAEEILNRILESEVITA